MRQIWYIVLVLVLSMATIGCVDNKPQEQTDKMTGIVNQTNGIAPGARVGNNIDTSDRNIAKSDIEIPTFQTFEGGNVTMLLPKGWTTLILPGCKGLITIDGTNAARTIMFINGMHQSIDPLPPGVAPEDYVTKYMQEDFKTVSDVKILQYEDADLSNLRIGGANVKAMHISFKNNGASAIGSFTVNTYGTNVSSAVGYVWGISSTEKEFEADGVVLLEMINSIKYDEVTLQGCRDVLKGSWGIKEWMKK